MERMKNMIQFKEITPESLRKSTFQLIGKDWMLVTAGTEDNLNSMTASWGGLGVMWGKNVAYIVVRPHRYTKEFIDREDSFSLSFFETGYRKMLNYMGSVTGRNEDKIVKSGLTVVMQDGTPCFQEASLVLICKKMFKQTLDPNCLLDEQQKNVWYPSGDNHTLYIAEITKILTH
ncbi:MAG: hypothetical protein K0S47_3439 [Herbinix sp.]|jgi:flavin reductase (DIM6/NTAB) family NADH-FMN oxidoreductase RutF|nr:hypothetical protein [Herbinix sp.]